MDFFKISTRSTKRGVTDIYPKFIIKSPSNDLMIRGGDFYAVWLEDQGLWSTDEQAVLQLIDSELDKYYEENASRMEGHVRVLHMWDAESGMIDIWHKYCQKQMRDNFKNLDETLVWANSGIRKRDYSSKRLPYALEEGDYSAYDKLMSVLYSPEERHKIEWAIGSIVTGDSKKIQKFLVLYGAAGTGKSTVLNIIQQLFDGYYSVFDARALGSSSNSFALESFKSNPLVAIQHDGDLSHIEDNTRLNSLVSHEMMTVNNKFEKLYSSRFKAFLFMGTNKPVKITDAKSGLIRRLIDVTPTGEKVSTKEYRQLTQKITFELGAIAKHCEEVYLEDPDAYDDYIPIGMLGASNDFYNFVSDSSLIFQDEGGVTLKQAWEMYKVYCDEAKVPYPLSKMKFKEELKNYFKVYEERKYMEDGSRVRNLYSGFRQDKFENDMRSIKDLYYEDLGLKEQDSLIDILYADCPAQYASPTEAPKKAWDEVRTKLKQLNTHKLHYVRIPENHIVIDFDIPDKDGNKSLDRNIEEAATWPQTYAELSKGGNGVHLHYIYDGDVSQLSSVYSPHIEVKVFRGKSALRRKLTLCNDIPVATISSGLPLKEKKGAKMVNFENVKTEKALRKLIIRNLHKEIHPGTKPSMDFINKICEDAYNSDLKYDISDMYQAILDFAMNSTNQADYCIKIANQLKLKSEEASEPETVEPKRLIFYDVEVFPNLLLVNWKFEGPDCKVIRMINPTPKEIEELIQNPLIGFNCRRYDNHILYARLMGYTNEQIYDISKRIVNAQKGEKSDAFFREAYGLSYTDVYDFAAKKQSLKKWEIELGIHHQELGLPWDKPEDESLWNKVAEYCDNDVIATEAVFNHLKGDFTARKILAELAGGTPNDTTNSLTTKIIFGNEKKPQLNYRFMGDTSQIDMKKTTEKILDIFGTDPGFDEFTVFDKLGRPIFPSYVFDAVKRLSTYRGEEVGEGGYVFSEEDAKKIIYILLALQDIQSMHPNSMMNEEIFGPFTERLGDLLNARIAIKHKDFEKAKTMLNGALAKYLDDPGLAKALSYALKIAINSVYGLTAAKFDNPFRDPRNVDNIVAKRGALFMVNLKYEVMKRGFRVAHIKTDSIKVPCATPEIIDFIFKYGKLYGYTFEHEATYEKMCLVNDAVYIAKYASPEQCNDIYGYVPGDNKEAFEEGHPWTATGTQFAVPYVFKTLFSHEPLIFSDMCETKEVKKGEIYLDMNFGLPDYEPLEKELKKVDEKYKKGKISDAEYDQTVEQLENDISKCHNYQYVGRVGSFCPIQKDKGGGELVCLNNGKYGAVTGTKDYRWLEAELVRVLGKEDQIDQSYYISLVDEAKDAISQYGDFEWFVSDEPVAMPVKDDDAEFMNLPEGLDDEVPWIVD